MKKRLIFLTGFMGAGKTTVGKILVQKLNFSFIDLDQEIENSLGLKITEIFAKQGEVFFRKKEHEILSIISNRSDIVIALGGGTFCFPENIQICKELGLTIYLKTSVNDLRKRYTLEEIAKRPLLKNALDLEKLFKEREKFYLQADFSFVTDNKKPEDIAFEIIEEISKNF